MNDSQDQHRSLQTEEVHTLLRNLLKSPEKFRHHVRRYAYWRTFFIDLHWKSHRTAAAIVLKLTYGINIDEHIDEEGDNYVSLADKALYRWTLPYLPDIRMLTWRLSLAAAGIWGNIFFRRCRTVYWRPTRRIGTYLVVKISTFIIFQQDGSDFILGLYTFSKVPPGMVPGCLLQKAGTRMAQISYSDGGSPFQASTEKNRRSNP